MGSKEDKSKKSVHYALMPLKGIVNLVKWFSIGFFKSFDFLINYLFDLFGYVFRGIYVVGTQIYKFFRYVVLGIYYLFNYFGYGIYATFILGPKTLFKKSIPKKKKLEVIPVAPLVKKEKKVLKEKAKVPENLPMEKTPANLETLKIPAKEVKKENALKKVGNYFSKKYNAIPSVKAAKAKKELERQALSDTNGDAKRSEIAQVYGYTVKDKKGKIIKGIFTGFSKLEVQSFLISEGYEVYEIKTSKWLNFVYGSSKYIKPKVATKDLVFWLEQLSTYIKSGIPLTTSVRILGNLMAKRKKIKRIFDSLVYELTMGSSFSTALEKQGCFPPLLTNMIKAAEATGKLEETLDEMANYYREIEKTKKQMISAVTYPIIILIFAIGVMIFILLYVIPQFVEVYKQAGIEVEGITLFLVNLSIFLKHNISFLLLFIFVIIAILVFLYKKVKAFRSSFQRILMRLPIFGNIIIYNEMTIFTKTFASLLQNNVFITDIIDILSKITQNEIYKDIMFQTIANVAKGEKISDAFKDHWAIPEVAYYMIVTGESTGELAEMMSSVSEYYQDMHRNAVNNIKNLIEPVLIVILAGIVGAVILAVIMPMFDLYESIQF